MFTSVFTHLQGGIFMKTSFSEIVAVEQIGKTNRMNQHEILSKAMRENLQQAKDDQEKVLLLGIDMQNDFMENGSLGVPSAHQDMENLLVFLYKNIARITKICLSIDTHEPEQIFHPIWWINEEGKHPEPYTIISATDVESGKWRAVFQHEESLDYVKSIEQLGKKQLCIWPYHCIEGTFGHSLESQFANLVYFHAIARKSSPIRKLKGNDPLTEMYGIFKSEIATEAETDVQLLNMMETYDKILVAGQAKSHCVLESVGQMLDHFAGNREMMSKIFVLEDCTSSIPGFEDATETTFAEWKETSGINLVSTTELII